MGYYMHQTENIFVMRKKDIQPALDALKAWFGETGNHGWANAENILRAKTFVEAMKECNWDVGIRKTVSTKRSIRQQGDVDYICFNGEKMGDDEEILNVIAPYVQPGSYIQMSGEEDEGWRWVFDGEKCLNVNGVRDFEGNCDIVEALLKHKEILLTLIGIHPALDGKIHKALKQT